MSTEHWHFINISVSQVKHPLQAFTFVKSSNGKWQQWWQIIR